MYAIVQANINDTTLHLIHYLNTFTFFIQAGILSENLTICLEPEAASLFCQYLPVEKFSMCREKGFIDSKPGTMYMIVDLGGNICG